MSKVLCKLCLGMAVYTVVFAALGNATDSLSLVSHTGGQYNYGFRLEPTHGLQFFAGDQIVLNGLSGVTGATLLAPAGLFAAPVTTPTSVTLTATTMVIIDAPPNPGASVPLLSVTSTVLTEGLAQFHVQRGQNAVLAGTLSGPGGPHVTVWRPGTGQWFVNPTTGTPFTQQWGIAGDIPVVGDFDGDGLSDYVVWRPSQGTWYVLASSGLTPPVVRQWGFPGDIPVAGDFDGDGKADFAVWRPSNGTWYIIPSSNPATPIIRQWGLPLDIPVAADFDGDGKTDFAVWRPAQGNWYISLSSTGATVVQQWGLPGDIPVVADFDGDRKADFAVRRPSAGTGHWFIIPSGTGIPFDTVVGEQDDLPVPTDYDGDGKADLGIWRPSTGLWGVRLSATPADPLILFWGLPGDVPINQPAGQLVVQH